ncbi:YpoC family protein [Listeria ilorinensis]|uniref:YpoC family protein n=1 Tax=Listeria ilorinensis TaxID=2867439 RepID=UPI001EF4925E|nr:hypothetical protein [Listeria ilorinensis]
MAEFKYAPELTHARFRSPDIVMNELDEASLFVSGVPFWQEQMFYTKGAGIMPWHEETDRACRRLNKHMKVLLLEIETALENKEKPNPSSVTDALGIFLSILFWSNHRPVQLNNLEEQIQTLEIKPLNLEERLLYCLERAHTFLGYTQLKELMLEQRKLIAKTE